MATVPTPDVPGLSLARADEPLIEPPQPVVRAESAMENPPPDSDRDVAAVYWPSQPGEGVDPDDAGGSGEPASEDDASTPEESGRSDASGSFEASGGLEGSGGEEPEDSSEADGSGGRAAAHPIHLFA